MDSQSIIISYFGFNLKFVIPQNGVKWQRQAVQVFEKNFKGFLVRFPPNKIDITVQFHSCEEKTPLGNTGVFNYLIPTANSSLEKKKFGSLLREIIMTAMLLLTEKDGGICIHSSSVYAGSKAILFVGNSGAGKSTICQLLPPRFSQLTDDTTFIMHKRGWYTSPLPIFEKKHPLKDRSNSPLYRVEAVFFLRQSKLNRITPLKKDSAAFALIMDNIFYMGSSRQIEGIHSLIRSPIPFYTLEFEKEKTIGRQISALVK